MNKKLGIQLRPFNLRNTFSRIVIACLVLILSLTITLSFLLYQSFLGTSLRAITENSRDRLGQNMAYMQFVREHVFSLGSQLMNDPLIRKGGFSAGVSPDEAFRLLGAWRDLIGTDSLIHSICLYNAKTGTFLSSLGSSRTDNDLEARVLEGMQNFWQNEDRNFYPTVVSFRDDFGRSTGEKILSVFFVDRMLAGGGSDSQAGSTLVINLSVDFLKRNMRLDGSKDRTNFLILNRADQVLFETGSGGDSGTLFSTHLSGAVSKLAETEGSAILNLNDGKTLLVAAPHGASGWRYLGLARFSDLFRDIEQLRTTILFVCTGIFLLAFLLSIFGAYNLYLPFDRLLTLVLGKSEGTSSEASRRQKLGDAQILAAAFMDILHRTNELEIAAEQIKPLLRKAYVRKMLNGEGGSDAEGLLPLPSPGGEPDDSRAVQRLFALVIGIDGYAGFTREDPSRQRTIRERIESVIATYMDPLGYDRTDFEEGYMNLIGRHDSAELPADNLEACLKSLQHAVQGQTGQTISCAVGFSVEDIGQIKDSCDRAREMIKYRFVHGRAYLAICGNDSLEPAMKPVSIERNKARLQQAVRSLNAEQAEAEIGKICDVLSTCQYDYIRLMLNQTALDLVHEARHLLDEETEIDANHLYDRLNQCETMAGAASFLAATCRDLTDMLIGKNSGKRAELVREAMAYVESHYGNPDLNLAGLADQFRLTAGYFGKLFAEQTGKSVTEHIMALRLEKAKELLDTTRLNVQDVSFRVGYANVTYFITVFKKQTGCTPNQYRLAGGRAKQEKL